MNIHPFSHRENPRVQNKQQYHHAKPTQPLSYDSLHFQGQRASAGSSQKQTKNKKGLSWLKCLLGKSGNSTQRQNQRGPTVKFIIKMSQALPEQMRIPTNALKEMNSTALQRIERFYMGALSLCSVNSQDEKIKALNDFIASSGSNDDGNCASISRAVADRLITGKMTDKRKYQYFDNHLLDTAYGVLYWKSETEEPEWKEFGPDFERIIATSGRPEERKILHQNFITTMGLQQPEDGQLLERKTLEDLKQSLVKAGPGSIALVYPRNHAILAINIGGDILEAI